MIGSVLLLRAEALDQVGALDERFFLYAEETDWAYRAHRLGWRHAAVHEVRAVHVGAGTSGDAARREAHFHASQERYLRKHYGALGWQCGATRRSGSGRWPVRSCCPASAGAPPASGPRSTGSGRCASRRRYRPASAGSGG